MIELKKTMAGDNEAIEHLEENKKRLQRDLEEKTQALEDKSAQADKVCVHLDV